MHDTGRHGTTVYLKSLSDMRNYHISLERVLTEGILGEDGLVSLQWLRVTLIVDSSDPELVLVTWLQPLHVKEWRSHMSGALGGEEVCSERGLRHKAII